MGFVAVAVAVVDLHIEEDVPDGVVLQQPGRDLLRVQHIRAVEEGVVEFCVIGRVQGGDGVGAGGGAAHQIGIVVVQMVLEPGQLGGPGVVRLVEAVPVQRPVAEYAEGVGVQIESR